MWSTIKIKNKKTKNNNSLHSLSLLYSLKFLFPSSHLPGKTLLKSKSSFTLHLHPSILWLERISTTTLTSLIVNSWLPTSSGPSGCWWSFYTVKIHSVFCFLRSPLYMFSSLFKLPASCPSFYLFLFQWREKGKKKSRNSQKRISLFHQLLLLPVNCIYT